MLLNTGALLLPERVRNSGITVAGLTLGYRLYINTSYVTS